MARSWFLVSNFRKTIELILLSNIFLMVIACTPPVQFEKYQIIPDVLEKAPLYKLEVNIYLGFYM